VTRPTVVGLDLSLTSTGIAVITGDGVQLQRVRSKGTADATLDERADRLHSLRDCVISHLPDTATLVVIEQPAFSRQTGHMHDRSGLWWLVIDSLHAAGHAVAEVTPSTLKKYATGRGNASKDEVLLETAKRFADVVDVTGNDVADALVCAAIAADHLGQPIVDMPAAHRKALDAVRWPDPAVTS
jgi:crossover junction endodeoxyribonuclease RuvC